MSDADSALSTMVETTEMTTPEPMPDAAPPADTGLETPVEQEPSGAEPSFEQQPEPREPAAEVKPAPNFGRDVARMIRELSDANPDKAPLLRQIREAVFRDLQYKPHFDTPEAAQRAKATFEAIGGEQGLTLLQENAEAVRRIDEQAAAGSPELIDAWMKESPEGLVKAAPYALEKISQANPQAFNEIVGPHLTKAVLDSGLPNSIDRLEWYASQISNPGLSNEIAAIKQWIGQLQQNSQQYAQKKTDPRANEFSQMQARLAEERAQLQNQQLRLAVQPHVERVIDESLKQHDRNGVFKGAARAEMMQAILNEIDKTLTKDKVYQANLSALKAKGNIDDVAKYIRSSVDTIRGSATRAVWMARAAPFQQPRSPAPAAKGQAAASPVANRASTASPVPAKPNHQDIDWDRDPDRMLFISGKAFLKNGRLVSWRNGKTS